MSKSNLTSASVSINTSATASTDTLDTASTNASAAIPAITSPRTPRNVSFNEQVRVRHFDQDHLSDEERSGLSPEPDEGLRSRQARSSGSAYSPPLSYTENEIREHQESPQYKLKNAVELAGNLASSSDSQAAAALNNFLFKGQSPTLFDNATRAKTEVAEEDVAAMPATLRRSYASSRSLGSKQDEDQEDGCAAADYSQDEDQGDWFATTDYSAIDYGQEEEWEREGRGECATGSSSSGTGFEARSKFADINTAIAAAAAEEEERKHSSATTGQLRSATLVGNGLTNNNQGNSKNK